MNAGNDKRLIRIGVFTMAAFAIFALALLTLGRKSGYFAQYYRLQAEFANVQGLKVGQPVWLNGLDVGLVERIALNNADGASNIRVTMTIETRFQDWIREDSKAILETKGLLGDKIVNITIGSQATPMLEDGANIEVSPAFELTDIMAQVGGVVASIEGAMGDIESVIRGVAEGQGTLGRLARDTSMHDEAVTALKNVNTLLNGLNNGRGTLGKLVSDDGMYKRVDRIVAKVENGEGTMGKLIGQNEIYNNLEASTKSLKTILGQVEQSEGTLGKVMLKDDLHEQILKLVGSLETLSRDIKENPGRYFKVSVFGGRN